MDLLKRFEAQLRHSKLLLPQDKILVACSGGPDSVALFHLLTALRSSWKFKISALHFNHQLRGAASQGDARFVRKLSKKNRVPFYQAGANVKKMAAAEKYSQEEAARMARYVFFEKVSREKKISKVVTAHTQEDQAETVLMRLLQGTGLRGLCGIRETFRRGKTEYVRPLLPFSKKEILLYLKQQKIQFRKDASNLSTRHLRNRIRLQLIPLLEKEYNPRVVQALARVPISLREESEALSEMEKEALKRISFQKKKGQVFFSRKRFEAVPHSIQFRILENGLRQLDPKSGLDFGAWQRLKVGFRSRRARYSLPKDIDLILTHSIVRLYKKKTAALRT
jgi:tRNA(Ile)-lysidine synthase